MSIIKIAIIPNEVLFKTINNHLYDTLKAIKDITSADEVVFHRSLDVCSCNAHSASHILITNSQIHINELAKLFGNENIKQNTWVVT